MKYTKNLKVDGVIVRSYKTHVATIDYAKRLLYVHGYWSVTTSKHINHVADVYKLQKKDSPKVRADFFDDAKKIDKSNERNNLKSVAMVMAMGNIFGKSQKESNDWKARMLKAGLEGRGLIMPEDWNSLDESEKERRLNGVIETLK